MENLKWIFVCLLLFVSCSPKGGTDDFNVEVYTPRYAERFEISGAGGCRSTLLRVRNPWQGAAGVERTLLIVRDGEPVPDGFAGEVLYGSPSRIVCISSTHIAMLDAVGAVDKLVGVSGKEYVSNEYVAANLSAIGDVGYEGNIDYEMLVSLDPDIVLLYGIGGASGMEGKLRELGIPFAYIGDYLEESPLGKAEWIVAVAEIAGCREEGERIFNDIPERYEALRMLVAESSAPAPKVMLNTPYGDAWFMAPTTSYIARLIADAGGDYIYRKNTSTRSLPVDLEEASLLVGEADVWINVGGIESLAELKRRLPKFADAECVVNGNVWDCDLRTTPSGGNDYWESGVIHPDLVLKDMIKIFHPDLLRDSTFTYYRQLKQI